jgi:hypothetical protein
MAAREKPARIPALRFPQWQPQYEAALRETDHKIFKRVEIAEAALLNCRDALAQDSSGRREHNEIEKALAKLRALKKDVLNFL